MIIDVCQISEKGLEIKKNFPIDSSLIEEFDGFYLEKIDLYVTLKMIREGIRARGTVKSNVLLDCSKCAEAYNLFIDSSFDILLLPVENLEEGKSSLGNDDLESIFYKDDKIDIKHLGYEQVFLAVPQTPVCDDKCKGICPNCGENLNHSKCKCENKISSEFGILLDKIKR